jgi:hypothetical protein
MWGDPTWMELPLAGVAAFSRKRDCGRRVDDHRFADASAHREKVEANDAKACHENCFNLKAFSSIRFNCNVG